MQLFCLPAGRAAGAGPADRADGVAGQDAQRPQGPRRSAPDARDVLGGNGLLLENHVARHLTDMEVVHTYEGTDNIQALLVGRDITGISAIS